MRPFVIKFGHSLDMYTMMCTLEGELKKENKTLKVLANCKQVILNGSGSVSSASATGQVRSTAPPFRVYRPDQRQVRVAASGRPSQMFHRPSCPIFPGRVASTTLFVIYLTLIGIVYSEQTNGVNTKR